MSRPGVALCVFCGSRPGAVPAYEAGAVSIARELARRNWQLVYGGGNVGLMGLLADEAMACGVRVTGVIPESLMQREVGHRGLDELHVVQTMHERKQLMAERADAFLALPGGLGTLEELFEVWTWRQLGYHARPIALLNSAGYFDPLLTFLDRMVDQRFVTDAQARLLIVDADPDSLLERIGAALPPAAGPADLART